MLCADATVVKKPRKAERVMTRAVVLSPAADLGGAERSLLAFLASSRRRGIEATVVLPREGRLAEALTRIGVRWIVVRPPGAFLRLSRNGAMISFGRLAGESPLVAAYLLRLAGVIRRISPHVIYTNGIKSHILGAALGRLVCRPVVWHARDIWSARSMGLLADLGAGRVIANSFATARALQRHMRQGWKVTVVHNAVDTDEFCPEGPCAISDARIPGELRLGLPGMLARIKGHGLLLRAAERIRREFPFARFFFIGGAAYDTVADQDYESQLRAAVQARGLADVVTFTGFQEDMASWLRAMDVVVNASIRPEGFGRSVLEAMSCGRAAVAPNAGGIPEFVRHGENGLLYPMGDADALAEAILALLRDAALRRQLGQAGRAVAAWQFSVERNALSIARILRESAGRVSSRRLG